MIHVVDKKLSDNNPEKLTATVIRQRFPRCVACPAENMARRPVPYITSTTEYVPGEVLRVDIKGFAVTVEARKHLRAFRCWLQVWNIF